jgi:phosphomannomutase
VGFKYISTLMEKEDILIGGEEAGGIGFKGYIPERDGTLAGLLLLEMMAYREKGIIEIMETIEREFGRFYYIREDIEVKRPNKPCNFCSKLKGYNQKVRGKLLGKKIVQIKDYDGVKFICEDDSWLLLRPSGTEPIVRIYAEAKSKNRTRELIRLGERLVGKRGQAELLGA